ncbi:MAG TPA: MAPEG family protein [Rhodopila sp.]|nr:MAPEG family protein [Rhodopila sp.]
MGELAGVQAVHLTTIILLVLALYVAQIFLQETSRFRFDLKGIVGNRDVQPEPSVIAARLDRAKNNLREALPIFIALALLALTSGIGQEAEAQGALVFLVARVVYVPAYVSGIPWLRSLVWLVSMAGLLMMALPMI